MFLFRVVKSHKDSAERNKKKDKKKQKIAAQIGQHGGGGGTGLKGSKYMLKPKSR